MIDITKTYTSNNYGDFRITKYVSWDEVHIEFILTGYKLITTSSNIRKGEAKDKLHPSVCGVGFLGDGSYKRKERCKMYQIWASMIQRCYSHEAKKNRPAYITCSVCEEWHNFQNFAKWLEVNYIEGLHIDKDIHQRSVENKIYSPETCKFVSVAENSIEAKALNYTMIGPDGKLHEIYNMTEFCRGKEVSQQCMCKVHRGEAKHHKGWTKA